MFSNIAFFKCVQIIIRHLSAKINKYVKKASNSNRTFIFRSGMQIWRLFSDFSWISFRQKNQLRLFIIVARNVLFEMRFSFIFYKSRIYSNNIDLPREEVDFTTVKFTNTLIQNGIFVFAEYFWLQSFLNTFKNAFHMSEILELHFPSKYQPCLCSKIHASMTFILYSLFFISNLKAE